MFYSIIMKTPGQIAYEKATNSTGWSFLDNSIQKHWQEVAQSILDFQWRSVDDPPEDKEEIVFVGGGNTKPSWSGFKNRNKDRTHWMPIPKMPPKSKDREEFDKWMFDEILFGDQKDIAWKAWQAARSTKGSAG